MKEQEIKDVDGGVQWWMYFICPGTAYILQKFEDGFGREIF